MLEINILKALWMKFFIIPISSLSKKLSCFKANVSLKNIPKFFLLII